MAHSLAHGDMRVRAAHPGLGAVRAWLMVVAALIVAMVVVGGRRG